MKAITEIEEGILVYIEVSTKSEKFKIAGYDEWRERIEIKVVTAPQNGRANKEIIKELSRITKSHVEIVSGFKSRYKTLKIYKTTGPEFLKIIGYP
jgi:uncharacterized protein